MKTHGLRICLFGLESPFLDNGSFLVRRQKAPLRVVFFPLGGIVDKANWLLRQFVLNTVTVVALKMTLTTWAYVPLSNKSIALASWFIFFLKLLNTSLICGLSREVQVTLEWYVWEKQGIRRSQIFLFIHDHDLSSKMWSNIFSITPKKDINQISKNYQIISRSRSKPQIYIMLYYIIYYIYPERFSSFSNIYIYIYIYIYVMFRTYWKNGRWHCQRGSSKDRALINIIQEWLKSYPGWTRGIIGCVIFCYKTDFNPDKFHCYIMWTISFPGHSTLELLWTSLGITCSLFIYLFFCRPHLGWEILTFLVHVCVCGLKMIENFDHDHMKRFNLVLRSF